MTMNDLPILSAEQLRQWDLYTVQQKQITSADLMEEAAGVCHSLLTSLGHFPGNTSFSVFCGKGNNGGDGLALARMLIEEAQQDGCERAIKVYILEFGHKGTDDFQQNLMRLHQTPVEIVFIQNENMLPAIPKETVVIDALFGSGLNRPLVDLPRKLVQHINRSGNEVIAIDIPSGMFSDGSSRGHEMIKATHTISFQAYKLAFLLPENMEYTGQIHIGHIGLDTSYLGKISMPYEMIGEELIKNIYQPRKRYSHKGDYGHAAIIAGSEHMMGATILAAKACMRSGVGKLTCIAPPARYAVLNTALPECITGEAAENFDAAGIGPGMEEDANAKSWLKELFKKSPRMVADAGLLNVLSKLPALLKHLPDLSILTPHPKEFDRLFGACADDFERLERAREKARELNVIIVLKGHHTFIAMPGGKAYFNTTGNPGMATAGSGDVLTGILTGLLAQSYTQEQAALLGVYLHGLAGDIAAARLSEEAMIASDIVDHLGEAFASVRNFPR